MSIFRDAVGKLRTFADQKGYTVQRAPTAERWQLFGPKGNAALGPRGTPSFRFDEAMKFLKRQADVEVTGAHRLV